MHSNIHVEIRPIKDRSKSKNQRPIKVTPSKNGVTLIALNHQPIKVTPSVNKDKLSFLWRIYWDEKYVGECMNKKSEVYLDL